MNSGHRQAARLVLAVMASGLIAAGWLTEALLGTPLDAAPAAQEQATPAATQRPTNTPRPTKSAEVQREELERGKLERENRLLSAQLERAEQQMALDSQGWRAPAQAFATAGPAALGFGFLLLAWRIANRIWPPPPRAAVPEERFDEDEDDL
jgi:hypothetical protein